MLLVWRALAVSGTSLQQLAPPLTLLATALRIHIRLSRTLQTQE